MVLLCAECGAEGDELATGWRACLAGDEDEREAELLVFCSHCAEREFGAFGWRLG
jgi:hypothetical protein